MLPPQAAAMPPAAAPQAAWPAPQNSPQPGQPQAQPWPQPGQPQAQPWPQPGQPQAQPGQPPQAQWGAPQQAPTCPRCASVGVWYPQAGIWGCEKCRAPIGAPVPRAAVPAPSNPGLAVLKVFGFILLIIVLVAIKLGLRGAFR
ncbi:MAG: hypothetical protein K8W52_04615 [Deltaproteobacteria bacterium]|nr:hypothetical protein [Deltaproteobacteria bacterium]